AAGAGDRDSEAIRAAATRGVDEGEVPHAGLRGDAHAPLDHDGVDDVPRDEAVEVLAKFRAVLSREDHGVPRAFEVQELAVDARVHLPRRRLPEEDRIAIGGVVRREGVPHRPLPRIRRRGAEEERAVDAEHGRAERVQDPTGALDGVTAWNLASPGCIPEASTPRRPP